MNSAWGKKGRLFELEDRVSRSFQGKEAFEVEATACAKEWRHEILRKESFGWEWTEDSWGSHRDKEQFGNKFLCYSICISSACAPGEQGWHLNFHCFTPDPWTLLKPLQQRSQRPIAARAPPSGPCANSHLIAMADPGVPLLGWCFAWYGLTSSLPFREENVPFGPTNIY